MNVDTYIYLFESSDPYENLKGAVHKLADSRSELSFAHEELSSSSYSANLVSTTTSGFCYGLYFEAARVSGTDTVNGNATYSYIVPNIGLVYVKTASDSYRTMFFSTTTNITYCGVSGGTIDKREYVPDLTGNRLTKGIKFEVLSLKDKILLINMYAIRSDGTQVHPLGKIMLTTAVDQFSSKKVACALFSSAPDDLSNASNVDYLAPLWQSNKAFNSFVLNDGTNAVVGAKDDDMFPALSIYNPDGSGLAVPIILASSDKETMNFWGFVLGENSLYQVSNGAQMMKPELGSIIRIGNNRFVGIDENMFVLASYAT